MWYNNIFRIWMNPKDGTLKKLAKWKNNFVFRNEFTKFTQDALNRYKITGAPDTVSTRVVLESMLMYGYVFFYKKNGNVIALPGMPDGSGINVYGDFSGAYVYGCNGYNERISIKMPGADESAFLKKTISGTTYKDGVGVMVRENPMMYPFINHTYYFSECIADTLRTIDVCRQNIKRPYIITAEESVVPTVKKYFEDVSDNMDYIVSTGVFPADKVVVQGFETSPDYVKVATALVDWYEQKYRDYCGFKNQGGNIDKKGENLISSEVTQNDEYTHQNVDQLLEYINKGLDEVNEAFGTSIKAEAYEDDRAEDISGDAGSESGDISGQRGFSTSDDN